MAFLWMFYWCGTLFCWETWNAGHARKALNDIRDNFTKYWNAGLQLSSRDGPAKCGTVGRLIDIESVTSGRYRNFMCTVYCTRTASVPLVVRTPRKCSRYLLAVLGSNPWGQHSTGDEEDRASMPNRLYVFLSRYPKKQDSWECVGWLFSSRLITFGLFAVVT